MRRNKGFTLSELLIVVAIIAVLVGISIPVFTSQLEKSREGVDLANVRAAYAEVSLALITEDSSKMVTVPLEQNKDGFQIEVDSIGDISPGTSRWKGSPKKDGVARVYVENNQIIINWGGEDHINTISAKDFLTNEKLTELLNGYSFYVVNSNDLFDDKGATKINEHLEKLGISLAKDYGATTWQIQAKESGSNKILTNPSIYWTTIELNKGMEGKYIPVIGFRNGKYDVYQAKVDVYNKGSAKEYATIANAFGGHIKEGGDGLGGDATFQFDNYQDAKAAYDKLLQRFETNGSITGTDLKDLNLN